MKTDKQFKCNAGVTFLMPCMDCTSRWIHVSLASGWVQLHLFSTFLPFNLPHFIFGVYFLAATAATAATAAA